MSQEIETKFSVIIFFNNRNKKKKIQYIYFWGLFYFSEINFLLENKNKQIYFIARFCRSCFLVHFEKIPSKEEVGGKKRAFTSRARMKTAAEYEWSSDCLKLKKTLEVLLWYRHWTVGQGYVASDGPTWLFKAKRKPFITSVFQEWYQVSQASAHLRWNKRPWTRVLLRWSGCSDSNKEHYMFSGHKPAVGTGETNKQRQGRRAWKSPHVFLFNLMPH